jgi:hypothetical protein
LSKKDVDAVSNLDDNRIVICHNKTIKREKWRRIKAKLIARHGTVKAVAAMIDCHPNAIRYAVEGRCPRVAARLKEVM